MSLYPGLDAPKPPIVNRLWVTAFFVILGMSIAAVYFATRSVDYIWRWYMVPQYFVYKDKVETLAEAEGIVAAIVEGKEGSTITVRGVGEETSYLVPAEGVLVDVDQYVYTGDVLAAEDRWKSGLLLYGLWITLKVSLISSVFALVIGIATGLARISSNPALRWLSITYIELVRGSPLLVQMMIWYFVIGALINKLLAGWGVGPLPTIWFGVLSLALFTGAYTAEIVRAGIQSVHIGQMEAARSLGMSYAESMRKIILPQAIRRILPALAGQFISLIKDSSLLGVISIRELTKITREVVTTSLQPFEFWIVCALLYLLLTFGLSLLVQHLERRAI